MEPKFQELSQFIQQRIHQRTHVDLNSPFAMYVRLARRKRRLSIANFAEQIGISEATLHAIENGLLLQNQIADDVINHIEAVLGISCQQFWQINGRVLGEVRQADELDIDEDVILSDSYSV